MALTSTMYNVEITLSDTDRNVYESLKCALAMHPSESKEFLATRLLAYCLEFEEGLSFTKGLSDPEQPALWNKRYDGSIAKWIEVGLPDANRLHKAAKVATRVAVYTHKQTNVLMQQLEGKRIHNGTTLPIYSFEPQFLQQLADLLERRTSLAVSVSGRQIYLDIGKSSLTSAITERMATSAPVVNG